MIVKNNEIISDNKNIYQTHTPCGYSMIIVDKEEDVIFTETYRGENCVKKFLESLFKSTENLLITMNKNVQMKKLTKEQENSYNLDNNCHICQKVIGEFEIKCMDHNHTNGEYRGPSHLICNINYVDPKNIPVIIHNLKNFDSNLILKELNQDYFKKCKVIPKTTEKFMSFSLDNVKFLDSYQFLSTSLDSLVNNLRYSGLQSFKITKFVFERKYGKIQNEILDILLRKSTYPYEYINSFEKFEEKQFLRK